MQHVCCLWLVQAVPRYSDGRGDAAAASPSDYFSYFLKLLLALASLVGTQL